MAGATLSNFLRKRRTPSPAAGDAGGVGAAPSPPAEAVSLRGLERDILASWRSQGVCRGGLGEKLICPGTTWGEVGKAGAVGGGGAGKMGGPLPPARKTYPCNEGRRGGEQPDTTSKDAVMDCQGQP